MKKTLFTLIALGTISLVSADQYGQPYGCQSGACPYNNSANYQGQSGGYYQGQQGYNQGQQYYQGQPGYNQGQQYYQGQPGNYNQGQQYNQGQPGNYNQGQQYSQNPYDSQQSRNQSYGQNSQYYQPNQQRNSDNYGNQNNSNQNTVSDQEIDKNVRNTLSSGWFSQGYQDVSFDVNNGNVTLKGSVDTLANKNKVENSVRKIDGVKQINNQITVKPNEK